MYQELSKEIPYSMLEDASVDFDISSGEEDVEDRDSLIKAMKDVSFVIEVKVTFDMPYPTFDLVIEKALKQKLQDILDI